MANLAWLSRAGALARRRPAEIGITLALIAFGSVWIYAGVRDALISLAASNLRALVAGQVAVVETWIGEKRLNVQRWAQDPRVVTAAEKLVAAAAVSPQSRDVTCERPEAAQLMVAIDLLRQEDVAAAVHLITPQGRIIASRDVSLCGIDLAAASRAALAPVFAGQSRFAAPLTERQRVGQAERAEATPNIWITAPLRDGNGTIIAALDIGKPARDRFSRLFGAASTVEGGDTYAFDRRGVLLSESRYGDALVASGRLRYGQSTILQQRLAAPDVGATIAELSPLVRLALAARDQPGAPVFAELLEPYTNYTGNTVVGAWRWSDELGFGIAVEVPETDAFAPLQRLGKAFLVLGVMVGIAVFGTLVALLRMERLRMERDEALIEARRVGNYELLEQVGQGGMARVYRARHRLLKRPTAIKIIELAMTTDEMLARFDREVRLASQLMHPNTVEIFDYGRTPENQPFYAMEFLDGLTLQQIVEAHGALPPARAAHVLRGIAGSLSEAHELGLVHRDIKPANVMLCRRGGEDDVVKVLDFGLVKDTKSPHTRDLTRALRVLGTPAFMAPERIERPDSADLRSDLYALGAVGFYLLVGRAPFDAESDLAIAYQVVNTPAAAVGSVAAQPVPTELEALIARCLAKLPEARPASAAEVAAALDALQVLNPWTNLHAHAWWQARAAAVN